MWGTVAQCIKLPLEMPGFEPHYAESVKLMSGFESPRVCCGRQQVTASLLESLAHMGIPDGVIGFWLPPGQPCLFQAFGE